MHKLLSLVLSVSIFVSSLTPALAQMVPTRLPAKAVTSALSRGRNFSSSSLSSAVTRQVLQQTAVANSTLQARILAGNTAGLASHILMQPAISRAALLRNEFVSLSLIENAVTPAQRLQAIQIYQSQLKNAPQILKVPQTDLAAFLSSADTKRVQAVQDVLSDASALALVGTISQATDLIAFQQAARGTLFEDVATLITARGLLRMKDYGKLEQLLGENAENSILTGMATYLQEKHLPVEVPVSLNTPSVAMEANAQLASFLGARFPLNRLHADSSALATQLWMDMQHPRAVQAPAAPQGATPAKENVRPQVPAQEPVAKPTQEVAQAPQAAVVQEEIQMATSVSEQPISPTTTTQQQNTLAQISQATPAKSTGRSGVLYSGVPVFPILNTLERAFNWVRSQFAKKEKVQPAPYEEPGLHDRKLRPIYEEAGPVNKNPAEIDEDIVGSSGVTMVPVEWDGFKLTLEDEDRVERILHNVDLTVSSSLKNFSPEYNRLTLDTNNYFELRNQTIPAKRPDHFYFSLMTSNGEFGKLIKGAAALKLARPLRIKIQRTAAPRKTVSLMVYDENLEITDISAEVDKALLAGIENAKDGQIVYKNNQLYFRGEDGKFVLLEDAFVRLPKAESKYWTKILASYPETNFRLGVFATQDKLPPVTYLVPMLKVGLGKTLAPVLYAHSNFSEDTSSTIMSGINNVLPGMMVFVHPLLKRYGEAAVLRFGAGLFALGGVTALGSGFYGALGEGVLPDWQLASFFISSICIALGTSITRYVQNLIMTANRGIIPQAKGAKKKSKWEADESITYNWGHLKERAKAVFTQKKGDSLRDIVYFQRGAMYKNLGTAAFLALPMIANALSKGILGIDPGFDFSLSYVPYTLFSLYTLHKVLKTPYKDSFLRNLSVLHNNLQDMQQSQFIEIAKADVAAIDENHPVIKEAAKQLKGAIDSLAQVEAPIKKVSRSQLSLQYESETCQEIADLLGLSGRPQAEIDAVKRALQNAFDTLEGRNVKVHKVARLKGMPTALVGMTLATFGELSFSNGFAFAMRDLLGDGTQATGVTGLTLYGLMFGWRVVGNYLSQRLSEGSMYLLSSLASVLGPLMVTAGMGTGSMTTLFGGVMMACFGVSNFFSQMYEYMTGLYPKYKQEIALLINLTMPLAALPMGLMRSPAIQESGIPGLDMAIAGLALLGSMLLTPKMFANSSVLLTAKNELKTLKDKVLRLFKRGGNTPLPPAAPAPAQ